MAETTVKEIVPSLIVGAGGTGYRILKLLKRKFQESGLFKDGVPPMIHFLSFDTDANLESEKKEDLLSTTEKVVLSVDTGQVLTNLNQFPQIRSWFPAHRVKETVAHGARQIRALGRLALFTNIEKVTDSVRGALGKICDKKLLTLPENRSTGTKVPVNVFLVGSTCGGTGSGMIVDLAYILQEMVVQQGLVAPEVHGYLFLPDAIVDLADSEQERIKANGAAALKELDFFMENMDRFSTQYSPDFKIGETVSRQRPFSFCYLVEGARIDRQKTLEMVIAEQMFHGLGTALTKDGKSYLANVPTNAFKSIPSGEFVGKKTLYSSVGVASSVFPLEKILDISSRQFAGDLMNAILNYANPKAEDPKAPWKRDLDLLLTKLGLVPTGPKNEMKVLDRLMNPEQVKKLATSKYKDVKVDTLGELIFEDRRVAEKSYDDLRKELAKTRDAVQAEQTTAILGAINEGMGDALKGVAFEIKLLDALFTLIEQYRGYFERERVEMQNKIKVALSTVRQKDSDLRTEAAKWRLFRNAALIGQLADEMIGASNQAFDYQVAGDRYEAGRDLLAGLMLSLDGELRKLKNFHETVTLLEQKFAKQNIKANMALPMTDSDSDWLLARPVVSGNDLEVLYADFIGSAETFESTFVGDGGLALPSKWREFADHSVVFEQEVLRYARKLLGDKLADLTIESFLASKSKRTGKDEIRILGEGMAETGAPLWILNTGIYPDKLTPVNLLGVFEAETTTIAPHVQAILQKDSQLITTRDPHRITLVQTLHGAPLFALKKIEEWESKYNRYKKTEFLHAVTEEELKILWDEHPFKPESMGKEEGIRYFTLGNALKFVQTTKIDGKTKYFATMMPDRPLDAHSKDNSLLGNTRLEAFEAFVTSQAVRKYKHAIEKGLDARGSYAAQVTFIDDVVGRLRSFAESIDEKDLKQLLTEELRSLGEVRAVLDRKRIADESEDRLSAGAV